MIESIRTSISLPKAAFVKAKKYNLNLSRICLKALEERIKTEEKIHRQKVIVNKLKKAYYNKGLEAGKLRSKDIPEYELKMFISTMQGEGQYGIWNIVDRIHDVFEKKFDYETVDNIFYTYDYGWVLKDRDILTDPEYSWITTDKPVDSGIQDLRAEAVFEYKYGFAMGLCNINELIEPVRTSQITNKITNIFSNDKLTKKQAIEIVKQETNLALNNQNTIFSNPNRANDLWWFEPTYAKFESNFFLILNDNKDRILYFFNILGNELELKSFRDRPEKGRTSITISGKDRFNFMDITSGSSNVKFSKYLKKNIKY